MSSPLLAVILVGRLADAWLNLMPSSSSSEEDLSIFESVAVDSHFIEKHAKVTESCDMEASNVDHPAVTGQR